MMEGKLHIGMFCDHYFISISDEMCAEWSFN